MNHCAENDHRLFFCTVYQLSWMSREKRLWSINFMLKVCFQSEIFSLSVKVSSPPSQVGSVQLQQSRGRNFTLCICNLLTSECTCWGRGMGLYTRGKECICTSQTLCVCVMGGLWLMQWIALHCNDEKNYLLRYE